MKSDTVFIFKDSVKGFSQSIFFEENKNSKYYDAITSFEFDLNDTESYKNSLEFLNDKKIKLKKQKTILPYTKWINLKQYKGEFYAYHPCDFYSFYKISISDTTYIDWTGEGPIANKIMFQKKVNDSTFEMKTYGVNALEKKITIRIIDKERGIAVFEEIENVEFKNTYFMIMADKIKMVPFIVNNCDIYKQRELNSIIRIKPKRNN
jgi:flagellar assembly factor FliW